MINKSNLRKAFIWNTLAAITNGCMSFVMTLAIMQLCGAEAGGVFSIAFSSAQMMQTVAAFGMRNYQATDVSFQFRFGEYFSSRVLTSFAMAVICCFYGWMMNFEGEKLTIYLLFCGVKLFDALADVLEGMVQQHDHLDCAAQGLFIRSISIIIVFVIALLLGLPLMTSSWFAFFVSALGFILLSCPLARKFDRLSLSTNFDRIGKLLLQCLPLFLVTAAGSYISNSPKIAIELYMDDLTQAQFAIVFMPAFFINLVGGFVFYPLLNTMAAYFVAHNREKFTKLVRFMVLIDVGITLITLAGAWLFGVPVLSWIYGVDISRQKRELLLVVLSGGFCALVSLLCQALTVARQQKRILVCYLIVAALTFVTSKALVGDYGTVGASVLYFLSMVLLTLFLVASYVYCMSEFNIKKS